MSRVFKTTHPKTAKIWDHVQKGDFIDGYAVKSDLSPAQAVEACFDMPRWASALMDLRNAIVGPLGLKTERFESDRKTLFPVTYEDDSQMVVGTDDSHLNFRISVVQQDGLIHMATWVHRNNLLGRIYLAVVMPFHILIVRNSLKRVVQNSPF